MTDPDTEAVVAKAIKNWIRKVCHEDIHKNSAGEWVFGGNTDHGYFTAANLRLLAEILDEKNDTPCSVIDSLHREHAIDALAKENEKLRGLLEEWLKQAKGLQ